MLLDQPTVATDACQTYWAPQGRYLQGARLAAPLLGAMALTTAQVSIGADVPLQHERFIVRGHSCTEAVTQTGMIYDPQRSQLGYRHITIEEISWDERRLVLTPALEFRIQREAESRLWVASDDDLGIHACGKSPAQLAEEIEEEIVFLWDAYACEKPERLTPAARRLRSALLRRIEEL